MAVQHCVVIVTIIALADCFSSTIATLPNISRLGIPPHMK